VEALNGILLPSALVFLILLANDKPVLGPWANSRTQNWIGGLIAWIVLTFSLAPLVTTFWPVITLKQSFYGLGVCTVLGITAAALLLRSRPSSGKQPAPLADPASSRRPPGMDRGQWRAELRERRVAWRTPPIHTLQRPVLSISRQIGLLALRGYIIFAIIIMVIKLIQYTTAHH
jgi:hypothetical protein